MKLILRPTGKAYPLGDLVKKVAEPIKRTIIKHSPSRVKTILENCNCEKRKEWLNRHVEVVI